MIRVPAKLAPYVDFEEGKIIARDLPEALKSDFEELKKLYESTKDAGDLTDY